MTLAGLPLMMSRAVNRCVNYPMKERGQRQGVHDPNASWAMSVHEKGVVSWQESLLDREMEGNLKGI